MSCFGCFDQPDDTAPQDYSKTPGEPGSAPAMITVEVIAPPGRLGVVFKGEAFKVGVYPAFTVNSGEVRYCLAPPFRYSPPGSL